MELASESANFSHGLTLLRELNQQRELGQFCDCVLQLHIHPGRLFLAHRSVLAAFSPVLASLLPRHGALLELNVPHLTPDTLEVLLDYIYTGELPPQSREEPVLSAALHLQIEQLQQALSWRKKTQVEKTHPVQDKPNKKRRIVEEQPVDGTPLTSPSYYTYASDPPVSSSPSCEVVPVICHVSTSRNRSNSFNTEQTGSISDVKHARESQHGYHQNSHKLDNNSLLEHFFEPAQSKQDTLLESSLKDLAGAVAEKVGNRLSSPCDSENASQPVVSLCSSLESKDRCMNIGKDLSSETESSQNSVQFNRSDSSRCVSDIETIQSFNEECPHLAGQMKQTSGPNVCHEISQSYAKKSLFEGRPLEILTAEKVDMEELQRTDHGNYEFSQTRKDYGNSYQGQLHYQYLLERQNSKPDSSDSDSDRGYPVSNAEPKDTTGLVTIDITEISLSTGRRSRSPGERSTTHPFQCSMCERAFSQRGSLNRHMRSHLGVRPYSCPRCSMTFSRQYRVTEHMRVHQRGCEGPPEGLLRTAATGMDV